MTSGVFPPRRKSPKRPRYSCPLGLFFLLILCWGSGCTKAAKPKTYFSPQPSPVVLDLPTPEASPAQLSAEELKITLQGDTVTLELPWEQAKVFRGYRELSGAPRESRKELTVSGRVATDKLVPQGVTLHYVAQGKKGQFLRGQLTIPERELPGLNRPSLEVDKSNYTLDVLDDGKSVKRYPIALGANPVNRKFCQDMASTPEGWYEVYNLQPQATYYRALDIDYPRPIDHVRHQLAIELETVEAGRPIGGEIQIHGMGIEWDWTAGCMALRDADMDDLFGNTAIRAGLPVFIAGSQLRPEDKTWLKSPPTNAVKKVQSKLKEAGFYEGALDGQFGNGTARALGLYQNQNGLPSSCQLDGRTREHFGL